jgi:alginate O-acetyltransferase complex protein AlgJ
MGKQAAAIDVETSATPSCNRVRRATNLAISVMFCVILAVPLFGTWLSDNRNDIVQFEQRHAAEFPALEYYPRFFGLIQTPTKRSLKAFPRAFETWFNDHLGFRRRFIQLFALARVTGLATQQIDRPTIGKESKSGVIIGREGQLFFCTDSRVWGDYRRTSPLNAQELAAWREVFETRGRWLAQRGIQYIVLVGPNAYSIYPEHMPRAITQPNVPSSFDRLAAELRSLDCVKLVDPRAALREAKTAHRTYFKADSHWNEYGAYVAYRSLMQCVAEDYPQAAPWELDRYTIEEKDCTGGDLARMIDSPLPLHDTQVHLAPRTPRSATVVLLPEQGDQIYRHVSSNPGAPLRSALVLHDCFFAPLIPHFAEHFKSVHYEGGDGQHFPIDLIERLHPTLVVQELVERRLMSLAPTNPSPLRSESPNQWAARPGDARR